MKHNCNVARDLMPLMLDGAASEESKALLNEHLEECAECKTYYAGMQAVLPAASEIGRQEQKAFDEATRKLRRKRRIRLWRRIAIGVLAGMVLMFGGLKLWSELTQKYNTPVNPDEYTVFLSQLEDGRVSVNLDFQGSTQRTSVTIEEYLEDGRQILYVNVKGNRIPQYTQLSDYKYSCTLLQPEDLRYFAEIREGTPEEYAVAWQTGDTIPAASAEMNQYFAVLRETEWIRFRETQDGKMIPVSFEENLHYQELDHQLTEIWKTVPEWQ